MTLNIVNVQLNHTIYVVYYTIDCYLCCAFFAIFANSFGLWNVFVHSVCCSMLRWKLKVGSIQIFEAKNTSFSQWIWFMCGCVLCQWKYRLVIHIRTFVHCACEHLKKETNFSKSFAKLQHNNVSFCLLSSALSHFHFIHCRILMMDFLSLAQNWLSHFVPADSFKIHKYNSLLVSIFISNFVCRFSCVSCLFFSCLAHLHKLYATYLT